ncbi:MAG: hypothetical protein K2H70_03220, partial [Bacteroidales bacterium]|nr:hypothetical protein [Bacteroidales bacterium]
TYTITVPRPLYDVPTPHAGAGETAHLKKFTFVVKETGSSDDPVIRDATAETADLPKLYLNPMTGSFNANTYGLQREAATPFDKISNIAPNTLLSMRNDCRDRDALLSSAATTGLNYTCYWSPSETKIDKSELFGSGSTGGYVQVTDENTNSAANIFTTATTITDERSYFNKLTWKNGCISYTDTVTIVPMEDLPAPTLSVYSDCDHLNDKESPFHMRAGTESGINIEKWEWVIRAENGYGGMGSDRVFHPDLGTSCLPDNDPTTYRPSESFGGGCIFEVPAGGLTVSVDNGDFGKYTIKLSHDQHTSQFSVSGIGDMDVPTLNGFWVPSKTGSGYTLLAQNGTIFPDFTNYACEMIGEGKRVYVRYYSNGKASPWAESVTGLTEGCAKAGEQRLGVAVENAKHSPGNYLWRYVSSDLFDCRFNTPAMSKVDTMATGGAKLQFYLTTLGWYMDATDEVFSIDANQTIKWVATDKDGVDEVFATLDGPRSWKAADLNSKALEYGCSQGDASNGHEMLVMIPAPSLYTVSKPLVRVRVVLEDKFEGYTITSGWPVKADGKMSFTKFSPNDIQFDVSDITYTDMHDDFILVEKESDVKFGNLEGKIDDSDPITTGQAMCVGEKLTLSLTGDVSLGATYQWMSDEDGDGTYTPISGETGATYSYTPDKQIYLDLGENVWNPKPWDFYSKGYPFNWRLRVTVGEEVHDHDFDVYVFWAEATTIDPATGVDPATAVSSGICAGEDVKVLGTPADKLAWYDLGVAFEYALSGSTTWNKYDGKIDVEASDEAKLGYATATVEKIPVTWNQAKGRFKTHMPTTTSRVCYAYSNEITFAVQNLVAGSVESADGTTALCKGQPNELQYVGAGDSFDWMFQIDGVLQTGSKT